MAALKAEALVTDTTPFHPRPDDASVRDAIQEMFRIIEYIAPHIPVEDSVFVRALVYSGSTVSAAMWALHDLTVCKGLIAVWTGSFPNGKLPYRGKDSTPPAGLMLAEGVLHIRRRDAPSYWGELLFTPDHDRLSRLRTKITTISDSEHDGKKKSKKRSMNRAATDCARQFKKERKSDPAVAMKQIISDYVDKNGGSAATIMRILNDNPDQWKDDKKATQ